MSSTWKSIISAIAPVIGAALPLPPPLGSMAMAKIVSALGLDQGATPKQVEKAMANATPEQLTALKKEDHAFDLQMKELDVDLERIEVDDRKSARLREVQTGDKTQRNIAYISLLGFFGVLGVQLYLAFIGMEMNSGVQRTLDVTTGVLFAMVFAVKDYYFGSSSGSKEKTRLSGM